MSTEEITEQETATGEIVALDTEEVSLVDLAANLKTFLIVKSDEVALESETNEESVEEAEVCGSEDSREAEVSGDGDSLRPDDRSSGEIEAEGVDSTPSFETEFRKMFDELSTSHRELLEKASSFDEMKVQLVKAQEELAASVALNKECRDLLSRVSEALSNTSLTSLTKADSTSGPKSNMNNVIVESELNTGKVTGFLRTSTTDLNALLDRPKK